MARIRTVKPAFFRSLTVTSLRPSARLTFIGLWTYVDDEGRGVDDARLLKAELWPLDDDYTAQDVEDDLKALDAAGLLLRYEVAGKRYLAVRGFLEHQKVNRPMASDLPPHPLASDQSLIAQGSLTEQSTEEGKGKEGKGMELARRKRRTAISPDFAPDEELLTWARSGHPTVDTGVETSKFVDYHTAKGSIMVDWRAAWRTWIRNAETFAASSHRAPGRRQGREDPNEQAGAAFRARLRHAQ